MTRPLGDTAEDAERWWRAYLLAENDQAEELRQLAAAGDEQAKADIAPGWAEIRAEYGQCITFQQVEAYTPPRRPGQEMPQQMHLDVIVDDLDAAEAAVIDLGATKHEHQPGTSFRVFLDPAGHPFCLCVD